MKTQVAQAFTVAQVPFNRVTPHRTGSMNVAMGVVGFGCQKVKFDAVVSIDHTYREIASSASSRNAAAGAPFPDGMTSVDSR